MEGQLLRPSKLVERSRGKPSFNGCWSPSPRLQRTKRVFEEGSVDLDFRMVLGNEKAANLCRRYGGFGKP